MALAKRFEERTKREDRRAGEVVSMLYNLKRGDAKAAEWQDFFPEWKEEREQDADGMFAVMMAWTKVKPGGGLST